MVNDSYPLIPPVQDKKKIYTFRDIKWADRARQFQYINGQPINQILHEVDNKILQNLPILREGIRMDEDIYGPSIPHLKVKTVRRKIQHVDPVKIKSVPKTIPDNYKESTIFCDIINTNVIGFLNTIPRHIMFTTGSMIKNQKIENIADGITQIHKLYLQRGFMITHIHTDCEFEPLLK